MLNKSWGTKSEMSHIEKLGTHCVTPKNRLSALENYIISAQERVDWVKIDRVKVLRYANDEIQLIKGV